MFRLLAIVVVLSAACTPQPPPPPPTDAGMLVCDTTAPTVCATPSPTYNDVKPLFDTHCVPCHNGLGEQWPMTKYQDLADWKNEIRGDILTCVMPPYDGGVPMPTADRQKILEWIRCDLPM